MRGERVPTATGCASLDSPCASRSGWLIIAENIAPETNESKSQPSRLVRALCPGYGTSQDLLSKHLRMHLGTLGEPGDRDVCLPDAARQTGQRRRPRPDAG